YKNGSDVAPAGAQEFERHPATYGRRAPVGHFGAADAELRTKPAGPKSEQPTENGPVATSLGRVQFEQNHSLRRKIRRKAGEGELFLKDLPKHDGLFEGLGLNNDSDEEDTKKADWQ
ncbi:hypothetical protein THAOC_23163, partial [Thalassiosira oceanica]